MKLSLVLALLLTCGSSSLHWRILQPGERRIYVSEHGHDYFVFGSSLKGEHVTNPEMDAGVEEHRLFTYEVHNDTLIVLVGDSTIGVDTFRLAYVDHLDCLIDFEAPVAYRRRIESNQGVR